MCIRDSSFAVQYMKVKKGKEILETKGIHTSIFFAPSHSYDKTTLKVLSKCGFKYISDGMSRVPIERYGIVCIPVSYTHLSVRDAL